MSEVVYPHGTPWQPTEHLRWRASGPVTPAVLEQCWVRDVWSRDCESGEVTGAQEVEWRALPEVGWDAPNDERPTG